MAKAIYIGGILVLAALMGVVFYSWLGGEQTLTGATAATKSVELAAPCPDLRGNVCQSQALAEKLVASCSNCHITSGKCRADYVMVAC